VLGAKKKVEWKKTPIDKKVKEYGKEARIRFGQTGALFFEMVKGAVCGLRQKITRIRGGGTDREF